LRTNRETTSEGFHDEVLSDHITRNREASQQVNDPRSLPAHEVARVRSEPLSQTTIGVVCTNARLDKAGCGVVAQGAHDGLARAVSPPHTRFDGDAFIAAATGEVDVQLDVVRFLGLTAVCRAIRSLGPAA
jgi:L-aminopeptidase/D-esterase-like protein